MAKLCDDPSVFLLCCGSSLAALVSSPGVGGEPGAAGGPSAGFLLGRVVLDEAELLTIAVHPDVQGQGIGGALVAGFLAQAAARGARRAFLEVAEDNAAARALYARAGFVAVGRRRGYFRAPDGRRIDAVVMARDLPVS
jgi:ribosomal-protein-alanine N-acetyltransferase